MKHDPFTIAIDGPAGAGKSTLAKAAAGALGMIYLDTGAMYRACGLLCLEKGISTFDEAEVSKAIRNAEIDIRFEKGSQRIFLNGEDVSRKIRTPEVSRAASDVSALPPVRLQMVALQREIAAEKDIVVDGRDIGTYVLPDAECKIFLTASAEVRAKRRYDEMIEKGEEADYNAVLSEINYRDKQDAERPLAPLRKAEDAVLLETDRMNAQEVLEEVLRIAAEKRGRV